MNQIAAGEVVERPASVVKELVENALDAGATRIEVTLERAGRGLIRVADNGRGMSEADSGLALERHATSKIQVADDLLTVETMGFRGEALPAIASVARMTVASAQGAGRRHVRVLDGSAAGGGTVHFEAGPQGTTITVEDLFFNVPARLKFLKTDGTELAACVDVVARHALTRPDVAFLIRHRKNGPGGAGTVLLETTGSGQLLTAIAETWGPDVARALVPVDHWENGVRVVGYVSPPHVTKATRSHQWIAVNGRPVRDRSLHTALDVALRALTPERRFPIAALQLWLDPRSVDVNVSPTKSEVRFREEGGVFQSLRRSVREALLRHGMVPAWEDVAAANAALRAVRDAGAGFGGSAGTGLAGVGGAGSAGVDGADVGAAGVGGGSVDGLGAVGSGVGGAAFSGVGSERLGADGGSGDAVRESARLLDRPVQAESGSEPGQGAFRDWGTLTQRGDAVDTGHPMETGRSVDPGHDGGSGVGAGSAAGGGSRVEAGDGSAWEAGSAERSETGERSGSGASGESSLISGAGREFGTEAGIVPMGLSRERFGFGPGFVLGESPGLVPGVGHVGALPHLLEGLRLVGQFDKTFLLCENAMGLVVIDQHVAHERILYEELLRTRGAEMPTQALLVPEVLHVDRRLALVAEERLEELAAAGYQIEPFGGGPGTASFLVRAVPFLGRKSPLAALRDLLEELGEGRPSGCLGVGANDVLATCACKMAVKAGDVLAEAEMWKLIADLAKTENPYLCPHGRPITVVMPRAEMWRKFKRA